MSQIDGLKRYLEAGLALTQITRSRAEELVHDLAQTGEIERNRAQEWVEDLLSSSRERSEAFVSTVRDEVRSQLSEFGVSNLDELAGRVARILEHGQAAARRAAQRPSRLGRAAEKAPAAKKAAGKNAPAKKAAGKKAPAEKAPAKKASAKKASTKKAPARAPSARKAGA
jgi:polyhydroxyalkanoate synthesis regulator phasin